MVSNWMMRETCLFNEAMVSALKDSAKRAKMSEGVYQEIAALSHLTP
jgi:hypothetical protein